jgi:hypothetical protein
MNISTTNQSIFLFELQPPFERIEFQFMPEDFTWDRTGNWVNVPIVGRNNSKKHLTGGEDRLSFQLDFNALFEDDKQLCIQRMAWLQSLTATDGFSGPARNVKLGWGNSPMFRHKIWIVRRVSSRMGLFHSGFDYNPMQAYIDVELELDPEENLRLDDIRSDFIQPSPFTNGQRFITN